MFFSIIYLLFWSKKTQQTPLSLLFAQSAADSHTLGLSVYLLLHLNAR